MSDNEPGDLLDIDTEQDNADWLVRLQKKAESEGGPVSDLALSLVRPYGEKYSPTQPRGRRGTPEGGRFVSAAGEASPGQSIPWRGKRLGISGIPMRNDNSEDVNAYEVKEFTGGMSKLHYGAIAVCIQGDHRGTILASGSVSPHSGMVSLLDRKDTIDNWVRFTWRNDLRGGRLWAIQDFATSTDPGTALENIYHALDRLSDAGMPSGTKVLITEHSWAAPGDGIETTVKYSPTQPRGRRGTPEGGRFVSAAGRGGVSEGPAVARPSRRAKPTASPFVSEISAGLLTVEQREAFSSISLKHPPELQRAIDECERKIAGIRDHEEAYLIGQDGAVLGHYVGGGRDPEGSPGSFSLKIPSDPETMKMCKEAVFVHNHPNYPEGDSLSYQDVYTASCRGMSEIRACGGKYRYSLKITPEMIAEAAKPEEALGARLVDARQHEVYRGVDSIKSGKCTAEQLNPYGSHFIMEQFLKSYGREFGNPLYTIEEWPAGKSHGSMYLTGDHAFPRSFGRERSARGES
jgi:hypothetical protein